MEIKLEELKLLKASLDYLENAITDVVGWANTPNQKIHTMHECKRVHQIAIEIIKEIYARKD